MAELNTQVWYRSCKLVKLKRFGSQLRFPMNRYSPLDKLKTGSVHESTSYGSIYVNQLEIPLNLDLVCLVGNSNGLKFKNRLNDIVFKPV